MKTIIKELYDMLENDRLWMLTNPLFYLFIAVGTVIIALYSLIIWLWTRSLLGGYWGYWFKIEKMSYDDLRYLHFSTYRILEKNLTYPMRVLTRKVRVRTWKYLKLKRKEKGCKNLIVTN